MKRTNVDARYCEKCGRKVLEHYGPSAARKIKYYRHMDPGARGYQCRDCEEPDIGKQRAAAND